MPGTIGRPTECTPEYVKRMADALREVGCIETALHSMPFSRATHYVWCAKGRDGLSPYVDYLDACDRARAEFIERNVIKPAVGAAHGLTKEQVHPKTGEIVELALPGDLSGVLWIAERTRPDLYNPRSKAFEFRTVLETIQAAGVTLTEEGVLNLAGQFLGVDPSEIVQRGDRLETADKRKRLSIAFLKELDGADSGGNGKANGNGAS